MLGRLFGGQAPNAGICLELGNVLGLGVVFVAGALGLLLLLLILVLETLLLLRRLTSIVQGLFFFDGAGNLVGSAKEVEILAYAAAVTKGIVVEGISGLVELVA